MPPPATGGFAALRSRDLRLLLAGQLISLTGSQMQQVAVVWQLYLVDRSPLALGLLGGFRVLPVLIFALGGGVVADAFDRRRLMSVTQAALALVSAGLAVATTWAGWGRARSTGRRRWRGWPWPSTAPRARRWCPSW